MLHSRPASPLKGFSLIELLVIITTIALLVSILLPALNRARDTAGTTSCLMNQKQLTTATHAYAADRSEQLPVGPSTPMLLDPSITWDRFFANWLWIGPTAQPTGHGVLMVQQYLTDVSAVRCPGEDDPQIYQADLDNLTLNNADVFSAYAYRSYDQTTSPLISNLGVNAAGLPARMLFLDVNRHGPDFLPSPATNHRERVINIAYVDGHAVTRDNGLQHFSAVAADYSNFPAGTLARFRQIVVNADFAEQGDPADAPVLP